MQRSAGDLVVVLTEYEIGPTSLLRNSSYVKARRGNLLRPLNFKL
jgi:hypothetical protein